MKRAIIFPGIGYHTDKPLLYYGKKLAKSFGYEIIDVPYGGFERGIKGDPKKMEEAFRKALYQAEDILEDSDLSDDDEILVISKSIGTVVAAAWESEHRISAKNIYFTPVEGTFRFAKESSGIAFHGTADPWVETEIVKTSCEKLKLPLYITEGANHSLETGDVEADLKTVTEAMEKCREYLEQ